MADTVKAFRLDRMHQLKIDEAGAMFERPSTFDPAKFLPDFGRSTDSDETIVRVRFDADVADIALNQGTVANVIDRNDHATVVDLSVSSETGFIGWMLGFDDKAVIESPESIIEAFLNALGSPG